MTYRKKLIEVALPLEAINMESAREKSIRHGHPSTLHLWWARRPLAACRAVLWASLVDDPSSWPDRFPTEADQTRERQRLFDILGRIETETDKKGNQKQVVRGLVSWDEVNDPNSGVLEAAQREIARCLAWERGEEPPTKPDAVRAYIAKYAPPVYDPFAGGGSIPLEAQRLGLEAHASDLNPVAVLINKALIEIPPKFRDQAPVSLVSRGQGTGNRGQGTGDREQQDEGGSVASGSNCLAEVDGFGGAGLSTERSLSEGRDVSFNQSDHASSGLDSSEHSRGQRTGNVQGLRQFSGDRQRVTDGNRDVPDVGSPSQLSHPAGSSSNLGVDCGNQQDANCPPQASTSALNSPITRSLFPLPYKGAQGLAADVRFYGAWMRERAFERIGHLYPKVTVGNREKVTGNSNDPVPCHLSSVPLTVIAWLWARTVKCPNPACGCAMPLVRSFQLSTKKGKEAWVEPIVGNREEGTGNREDPVPCFLSSTPSTPSIRFVVKSGQGQAPEGTVDRKGARCIACETPVPLEYVRQEGRAGRMGQQMMAIVAEGQNGRVYLAPTAEQEAIANAAQPQWKPDTDLPKEALGFRVQNYGMTKHADLFTPRQLVALTTFSDLVGEAREQATQDAVAAGLPDDDVPLNEGGTGARAYGDAIATYLAFAVDRISDYHNSICTWVPNRDTVGHLFTRQAIPMAWDFCEANPLSSSSGNFDGAVDWVYKVVEKSSSLINGQATQHDATAPHPHDTTPKLISTDPPYYSAVPYADLSDFFYVWLRRSLGTIYPSIFNTVLVPKAQELVADHFRHGGHTQAKDFFEAGLVQFFHRANNLNHPNYPVTVYYALKQTEEDPSPPDPLSHKGRGGEEDVEDAPVPLSHKGRSRSVAESNGGEENPVPLSRSGRGARGEGRASTGWETILEGLIQSNFSIDGTWPIRTEREARTRNIGSNALASSIVLVCRPRPTDAPKITRRQFLTELKRQLPKALKTLQQGNIAPVDLAQASIGPGMAIYSQYSAVLENDGTPLRVRTALQLINQYLDEYLTEQESEFDSDTRWALTWFEQYQFNPGPYGDAETLSKAKNTSVQGMVEAGILEAKGGKVRLLPRQALLSPLSPGGRGAGGEGATAWLITQALIHTLDQHGETGAAALLTQLGDSAEIARDLAYRLYNLCDRKGWTQEAIAYNSLVISWPEINRLASEVRASDIQTELF